MMTMKEVRRIPAPVLLLLFVFGIMPLFASAQNTHNSNTPNPYMDAKLTPSMAIIIVVLIAAMFFMGFFSIYIRHCNTSSPSGSAALRAVVAGRSRRGRGLTPENLLTMPTFTYSEVKNIQIGKGSALECAVCLNEFDDDETLRLLPICDHVFHSECIDLWLASHTTCPVCRANLEVSHTVPVSEIVLEELNPSSVSVTVTENQSDIHTDGVGLGDINQVNSPNPRNPITIPGSGRKWRFASKFPRSHSTGHSLVQPGENCERFTLRLPVGVRRQLVNRSMNRAAGMAMLPREESSKGGYRAGGEGSSRGGKFYRRIDSVGKSDRWGFSAPSFFTRAISLRSPRVAADSEGSWSSSMFLTAVKAPLNCLGAKGEEGGTSSSVQATRLPV